MDYGETKRTTQTGFSIQQLLEKPGSANGNRDKMTSNGMSSRIWFPAYPVTYTNQSQKAIEVTNVQWTDASLIVAKKPKTPRRFRSRFSANQIRKMEERFSKRQYIVGKERRNFAEELGLNENQVKVWFQNRRTKWRQRQRKLAQHLLRNKQICCIRGKAVVV